MAGRTPAGSIVTNIELNGTKATTALRDLKQAVQGATTAWRAQQAQLKAAGDATQAAEAKFKGLGEAINKQKQYIEGLTQYQRKLEEGQRKVDTSTKQGKQEYDNFTEAIKKNLNETNRASTRLESLTKQQDRAKKSLEYFKSGLSDLQREYRESNRYSKAYINQLESEGKHVEATQQRIKTYKSNLDNLTKQQKIQTQELERIAKESGKTSNAYKNQKVRVAETASAVAKMNSKLNASKKALSDQTSGLKSLEKNYKAAKDNATSYIERLKSENKNYEAARVRLNSYKTSIANLTKQQKIQQSQLSQIASKSGMASRAYIQQKTKINQTITSINKYSKAIKDSQKEVNRLNPRGFNKLALNAQKVTNATDKMKSKLRNGWDSIKAGAGVAAAGIGAVSAAAVSGAKKAGDLEQTYREINNLATLGGEKQSEVTKNLTKMQEQGRTMSIKYGESQENIAKAYEDLIKRGYTSSQALGAMKTELQASVASGDKFSDVTTVSSQTLEAFGMKAKSSTEMLKNTKTVVNELAYSADATSTGFSDLGVGMSYVGSTAHQAGISLSETASAMGVLSNNGLEADKAGTGLRKVINSLNSEVGKIGSKNSVLTKLGIKKSDIVDSSGKMKNLSTVMGVLHDKMKGMSKVEKVDLMKSLFGTTGMQAGLILSGNTKELARLTKETEKAGKTGSYVQKLADKNMKTAKGSIRQAKAAMEDFKIVLGAKLLPVMNKAGEKLAKFLSTKDGKKFEDNVAGALTKATDALINFLKWSSEHQGTIKALGIAFATVFSVVKIAKFIKAVNKVRLAFKGLNIGKHLLNGWDKALIRISNGKTKIGKIFDAIKRGASKTGDVIAKAFSKGANTTKGLFGKGTGAGKLNGLLQSSKSAGGFKNLTTAGKIGTSAAGIGIAVDTATSIVDAIKDKAGSKKQYEDIGTAAGKGIGGAIGLWFGGPAGAAIGTMIGGKVGKWAGDAAKKFQKGWNAKKPPKKFWSIENMGYSAHNMWKGFKSGVNNILKWFKKNWKEIGLYFVNPIAGAINSLYKHNKKFRKWVNSLVKGFKSAWKGITKWFSNLGKSIQKAWKGMTSWFSKLGKNMAKGLKSAWKSMTKWFANIGKGIQKAWKGMTSWFKRLGSNMAKGLKSAWKNMTSWFSNIGKGIKNAWSGMTNFFGKIGSNTVGALKKAWNGVTSWFSKLVNGIKDTFDKVFGPIVNTINKVKDGIGSVGKKIGKAVKGIHFANGTNWRSRYGTLAILNDGHDSPSTNNREAIINEDGTVELLPNIRNYQRILRPGQEVINARDTAKLLKNRVHLASGTVSISNTKLFELAKKNYQLSLKKYKEDKKRHDDNKKHRDKRDHERDQEKKTKKKTASHKDQKLVDRAILTGSSKMTGKAIWISDALYKKLTTSAKSTTKRKKRSRSKSRTTTTNRITKSSVVASVRGASSVSSLAKSIKSVAGTHSAHIKINASGISKAKKSISSLNSSIKGLTKKKSVKLKVTYSGTYKARKSFDRLNSSVKSTSSKFKTIKSSSSSAGKSLKTLNSRVSSTNSRIKSLNKTLNKEKFGKAIKSQAEEAVKSLKGKGNFSKQFESMTKKFGKDLKSMSKDSKKEFSSMWSHIKSSSSSGQKSVQSNFNTFSRKYKSGWNSLNSGVKKTYSKFWTSMRSTAKSGLNRVLDVLNSGIGRIDSVISNFGGSSHAVSKVKRLATGTGAFSGVRREITRPTLAILNDGNDSPETQNKETIWDRNTGEFGVVQGRNTPFLLQPGQEVLNATESRLLGFTHYATGTGALKKLYEEAKKNWKSPTKTGKSKFGDVSGLSGAINSLANHAKTKVVEQGVEWWSQLWKMVEDKVNDTSGDVSGLLKEAIKVSKGKPYVWGAKGPDEFDCSGLVEYAAKKVGITLTAPSGNQYSQVEHIPRSEIRQNDLVFYGSGGNEHVGIVKDKHTYWSAHSPSSHPNIGWDSIDDAPAKPILFGRIRGYHPKDDKSEDVKTNNKLQRKIKNQVGNGFWKTIKKIADEFGDASLPNVSGSAKAWTSYIKRAAEKMHTSVTSSDVAKIVSMIQSESGGNAGVTQTVWDINMANGNPAQGLLQFIPQTFKAFAVKGHEKIKNGYDQLLALFNDSNWKNDIHYGGGWGPSGHRRFANGGIANQASIFGEAGPEMAIPLAPIKATRAYELLGKTAAILASQDGSLTTATNQSEITKQQKEEHDFRQAVLLLLEQLLSKNNDVNIKLTTPEGRTLWEVVKPFEKAEQRASEIRRRKGLSGSF